MQRRSMLGRVAAALAGLFLRRVPDLEAAPPPANAFSVSPANLPQSSGIESCPICHTLWDSLQLTPAGPCLHCADSRPELRAEFESKSFWILSPKDVRQLEVEIGRLAAKLHQISDRWAALREQQLAGEGQCYNRAVEAQRSGWLAMQRELHLLHLLRAASRQYHA